MFAPNAGAARVIGTGTRRRPRRNGVQDDSRLRRAIPVAIFAVVLLLGLALAWALHLSARGVNRARLAADVEEIARAVEIRMGQNVAVLRAAKALIEIEPQRMTRPRFSRFISKIDLPKAYPGLRGVAFAARVPVGEEAELRSRYDLPRDVFPPTVEAWRAPVVLIEPHDERNEAALGYDMYSDPVRRAAMIEAEAADQPVATAPVILVQEITSDVQNGFLVYLPTRDEKGALFGFAYAPFRIGDFLSDAGVRRLIEKYEVRVDDVTAGAPAPLFSTQRAGAAQGEAASQEVNVAARKWRIVVAAASRAMSWSDIARPLGIAVLALILATLVGHAYRDQQRAREIESALADERLKALSDREVLLQEMNHRIKNAIARIGAIARSTARGAADLDDFQRSFSGRLAAMAAAQDLVTRGADAAALQDVLRAELDQIFPQDDPRLTVEGPPAHLDTRATQAMALVAHELATNAAKHGAARDPAGRLAVRWSVGDDGVQIDWIETCAVEPEAAARKGFGSRLINMLIEGELKGRVERELRADGLRLRLSIPLRHAVLTN